MNREELEFKYFFNAGLDRVTCECDVEGTDVFQNGHYIGSVKWKLPDEVEELDDYELEIVLAENGILL
jgi:hypothetical protein